MSMISRGVSQIIAFLIVLAVSIALILAFVTWLHGVNLAIQHQYIVIPQIIVSRINSTQGIPKLVIYYENRGTETEKIIRIDVEAGQGMYVYIPKNGSIELKPDSRGAIIIPPPNDNWTVVGNPSYISPGFTYRVRIYMSDGSILLYDLVAQS